MSRKPVKVKESKEAAKDREIKRSDFEERTKPETLEQVARWYYIEERSQREIAGYIGYSDPSAVARLIKEAVERRVVEFNIDGAFAIGGREDLALSRRLRDIFDLEGAIVIQPDSPPGRYTPQAADDFVHLALANIAGSSLKDRLQPNDRVGVGPGRAVYQCARMLKRRPPSRKGVRIIPLSGKILPKFWEESGPLFMRPLDADDSARMLAYALGEEPETVVAQLSHPLFTSSREEAVGTMEILRMFLPDGTWSKEWAPRMAITGVGVTAPEGGHRFVDLYRQKPDDVDPLLARAKDDLKRIMSFTTQSGLPHCGDVNNRLFPSLFLPEELADPQKRLSSKKYGKLIDQLDKLNERIVAVGWKHMNSIPTVVAIAGGPLKMNAIWTLLITGVIDPSKRIISEIITDADSANKLIAEMEMYGKDAFSAGWYREMTQQLFVSAPAT